MAESRLIGQYPVIGIRPVIDARRGMLKVRESLEEQTMNMARAAADLFRENLRYTNWPCSGDCALRRPVQERRRGYHPDRDTVLVLWFRDDGYGSHDDQGRMGI